MKYYKVQIKNNQGQYVTEPSFYTNDTHKDLIILEKDLPEWKSIFEQQNKEFKFIFSHEDLSAHYTPFGHYIKVIDQGLNIGEGSRVCSRFFRKITLKKCQFDLTQDSACDHCVFCGQPEERL